VDERVSIRTARLELVAATAELAELAIGDGRALADKMRARVPRGWPPPLTEDTQVFMAQTLAAAPHECGWWLWYFIDAGERALVGQGGFKGPPQDGTLEVGYSIVEVFQRRGFATEAVGALLEWAFVQPGVERVIAHTYRHLHASIRVMEKNGLVYLGAGEEEGLIRYGKVRECE
jgi:RimJ/RimL family protein N-acetyltransferase